MFLQRLPSIPACFICNTTTSRSCEEWETVREEKWKKKKKRKRKETDNRNNNRQRLAII